MMYHLLWANLQKMVVVDKYATEDEVKEIASRHHIQILYKREISVSKTSE